ncbi:tetratricopeptide repeat protein [Altererythrobacter sp. MTPC7]|uniref:tetratricopeptide repeat protein n=1 Tax=Altererythrobacter sp. MTPC7 TaxID=3056567 RepID=UPI0036F29828
MRGRLLLALTGALALAGCEDSAEQQPAADKAAMALARGDGFAAEDALREQLRSGAARETVAAAMGEAELQQGQLAEARKWLGPGRFTEDTAGRGFLMLGRLEMRAGNLPAAGTAYDQALRYIRDDAELWVDIARLRYRGGEQTQAVDAALRAMELDPDNPSALLLRGQLARDAEGMAAALPFFEKALERQPDNLDLLAEYSATLGELGRASESLAMARRIVKIDPAYQRAYFLQAVIAARGAKFDLARKLLTMSGDHGRDTPAGIMLGGVIDMEQGNHASAAQAFDRLNRLQPENRQVRELLARSLSLGGNHRELVYRFDREARLRSASPYMRIMVARAHEALGNRDLAAALLDRAADPQDDDLVAMQPAVALSVTATRGVGDAQDALSLVRGRIVTGDRSGALAAARAFQRRYPGSADAFALLGDAYLSNRQVGPALQAYEKAAGVRRTWPLARRMIAALRASGRRDAAIALGESHLAGNPSNGELASMLARFAYDAGDMGRASRLLDQAMSHGYDRDADVLSLRAMIAKREGLDTLALQLAHRAVSIQPQGRAALQALSMVEQGDTARSAVAKARMLDEN